MWCLVAFGFVALHVPETRGKTLEEIETVWRERAEASRAAKEQEDADGEELEVHHCGNRSLCSTWSDKFKGS